MPFDILQDLKELRDKLDIVIQLLEDESKEKVVESPLDMGYDFVPPKNDRTNL